MAGLLGDSFDDPRTLATLQMAAGLLGGGNFGQAAGRGLGDYQKSMAVATEQQRRQRELAMQEAEQRQRAQVQAMQAQKAMQEQQALQAAAARQQSFIDDLLPRPVSGGQAASSGGLSPESAAQVGRAGAADWVGLSRKYPDQIELIKKLSEAQNFGKQKVARTVEELRGGKPVTSMWTEHGERVGEDIIKPVEAKIMDRGGEKVAYNPFTLAELGKWATTMTPEGRDASARGWAGVRQADARLAYDKSQGGAKAPAGYRFNADGTGLEAIPGGPADIKAGIEGAKAEARKEATLSSANSVLETISEAKKLTGWRTAGAGGLARSLPMTDARELAGKVETIKANLGFDRLQEMRQNSPTGGALGAVAVQELTALQSTVASLDQLQGPGAVMRALDKIEGHYKRWAEVSGGKPRGAGGVPADISDIMDKYK